MISCGSLPVCWRCWRRSPCPCTATGRTARAPAAAPTGEGAGDTIRQGRERQSRAHMRRPANRPIPQRSSTAPWPFPVQRPTAIRFRPNSPRRMRPTTSSSSPPIRSGTSATSSASDLSGAEGSAGGRGFQCRYRRTVAGGGRVATVAGRRHHTRPANRGLPIRGCGQPRAPGVGNEPRGGRRLPRGQGTRGGSRARQPIMRRRSNCFVTPLLAART